MAWFESSTPVLGQLGATFGGGGGGSTSQVDYSDLFENIQRQQAAQADREYQLNRDQLDQQYSIAKLNAKTARERNEIDKWYNQQQVKLAQDRLAFDRESFEKTFGLNQAKLGYDVLNTAANMRGADDYFQASNYMRGVANDPNSATFLNALKNNITMPAFTAASGVPDAFTMGSLTSKLGTPLGAPAAGGGNATDAYLNQIHALGAAGARKLGAGSLEQLTDNELGLLKSGLEAPDAQGKAFNFSDFLKEYRNSRIGQGLSNSAAA